MEKESYKEIRSEEGVEQYEIPNILEKKKDAVNFILTFENIQEEVRQDVIYALEKREIFPISYFDMAQQFIMNGEAALVANNINIFLNVKIEEELMIANLIIEKGHSSLLIKNFEKFTRIPKDQHFTIAKQVLKKNSTGDIFIKHFEKFDGISPKNHLEIVKNLIRKGNCHTLIKHFDKFPGVPKEKHYKLVKLLIKAGFGQYVTESFDKFSGVPKEKNFEIIKRITKKGHKRYIIETLKVIKYFDKFFRVPNEKHYQLVQMFIKAGGAMNVLRNFDKFPGVPKEKHFKIVKYFIKKGHEKDLVENLEKFNGLGGNEQSVVLDAAVNYRSKYNRDLYNITMSNFEKFSKINGEKQLFLVKTLIEKHCTRSMMRNFHKLKNFEVEDLIEILNVLIKKGASNIIIQYFKHLSVINKEELRKIFMRIMTYSGKYLDEYLQEDFREVKVGEMYLGNFEEILPKMFKNKCIYLEEMFKKVLKGKDGSIKVMKKEFNKDTKYISQKDINKVRALDIVMTEVKKELLLKEINERKSTYSKEALVKYAEFYTSKLTTEFCGYMKEILSEDLYEYYSDLRGGESEYFVQSA